MGTGDSLLLSQKPEARPYPAPNQYSTYSLYHLLEIHFNIIFQSTPLSSKLFHSLRFPHQNPACTLPFPNTCYMFHIFHSSLFIHPNNIWSGLHIIKLLEMQSSSLPYYLVLMRPKYLPQRPILENPQPTFLPQWQRPSFAPTQNNWQNYQLIYRTRNSISLKYQLTC